MRSTSYLQFLAVLAVIGIVAGCIGMGGGGGDDNDDSLALEIITWDTGGETVLTLSGPTEPSLRTVTYFIFGSAENFGKNAMVPLRFRRTAFGPGLGQKTSPKQALWYHQIGALAASRSSAAPAGPGR
jgi:hypothetical protein